MACLVSADSAPSTGPSRATPGREGRGRLTRSPVSQLVPSKLREQGAPLIFQRAGLLRRGLDHRRVRLAAPPLLVRGHQFGRALARVKRR